MGKHTCRWQSTIEKWTNEIGFTMLDEQVYKETKQGKVFVFMYVAICFRINGIENEEKISSFVKNQYYKKIGNDPLLCIIDDISIQDDTVESSVAFIFEDVYAGLYRLFKEIIESASETELQMLSSKKTTDILNQREKCLDLAIYYSKLWESLDEYHEYYFPFKGIINHGLMDIEFLSEQSLKGNSVYFDILRRSVSVNLFGDEIPWIKYYRQVQDYYNRWNAFDELEWKCPKVNFELKSVYMREFDNYPFLYKGIISQNIYESDFEYLMCDEDPPSEEEAALLGSQIYDLIYSGDFRPIVIPKFPIYENNKLEADVYLLDNSIIYIIKYTIRSIQSFLNKAGIDEDAESDIIEKYDIYYAVNDESIKDISTIELLCVEKFNLGHLLWMIENDHFTDIKESLLSVSAIFDRLINLTVNDHHVFNHISEVVPREGAKLLRDIANKI